MPEDQSRTVDWDETTRPRVTPESDQPASGMGEHLVLIHDMFRRELDAICEIRDRVRVGADDIGALREQINALSLREAFEQFGAFCAQYCRAVNAHHSIEDAHMFPALRRADDRLGAVIDRLGEEHVTIHQVLVDLDRAAVALAMSGDGFEEVDRLVDVLASGLRSHLTYEESQLVAPLSDHRIVI